jgi:membrane protease subunit (stomatin/prohibitin family)
LPLIGARLTSRVFGQSPFKAEVYFVNRNVFLNLKWGTRDPIAYRDRELALVRLRAHGEMAVRASDPVLFVNKLVGARGLYTARDIEGSSIGAIGDLDSYLLDAAVDLELGTAMICARCGQRAG